MKATSRFLIVSSLLLTAPLHADEITLTNGEVLSDVEIDEEGLKELSYTRHRKGFTVASDQVRQVSYERLPEDVDQARSFVAEGDLLSAVQYLDSYVDRQVERSNERKYPTAPAYAAWRAVEIRTQLADWPGAIEAAKRLLDNYASSRYVPLAYLAKAQAEQQAGKGRNARATLDKLAGLVSSSSLSKRWDLECRLAKLRADGGKEGDARRGDLKAIADEAGTEFSMVRLRATVAQGESFLAQAEGTVDSNQAKALRENARALLESVTKDQQADAGALAGAYTGLGDCGFFAGAAADDREVLQQAVMNYLRVVTLYEEQSRYVPKALFYAMRCFHILGATGRKADMKKELLRLYPESEWAKRPEVTN